MSSSLRILAVCAHNRTRSVLMGALLTEHVQREGTPATVKSAGFTTGGEPPTEPTVRFLATRGIEVGDYVSHWMTRSSVDGADLIVTAEQDHVVAIAGRWPASFGHTFTLPELVDLATTIGPRDGCSFHEWLAAVNNGRRTADEYLATEVGQIADPTGGPPAGWSTCFTEIDDLAARLAVLLA